MSLIESLNAAFATAQAKGGRPFRLHLLDGQIDELRTLQKLEPASGTAMAIGAYNEINIFSTPHEPILFAQPSDQFRALYLPIEG